MTEIAFRAAHISEAAAIAGMSRLHVEYGLRWRWTPARVKRHIRDADTMVLVASKDGSMVGFAIMEFGDIKTHLLLLATDPVTRRIGVGSGLVDWLVRSCRTAGIQHVQVEVRSQNKIARHFYHSLGFRFLGQIAGYYDRRESATIMSKTLQSTQSTPH